MDSCKNFNIKTDEVSLVIRAVIEGILKNIFLKHVEKIIQKVLLYLKNLMEN